MGGGVSVHRFVFLGGRRGRRGRLTTPPPPPRIRASGAPCGAVLRRTPGGRCGGASGPAGHGAVRPVFGAVCREWGGGVVHRGASGGPEGRQRRGAHCQAFQRPPFARTTPPLANTGGVVSLTYGPPPPLPLGRAEQPIPEEGEGQGCIGTADSHRRTPPPQPNPAEASACPRMTPDLHVRPFTLLRNGPTCLTTIGGACCPPHAHRAKVCFRAFGARGAKPVCVPG